MVVTKGSQSGEYEFDPGSGLSVLVIKQRIWVCCCEKFACKDRKTEGDPWIESKVFCH